MEPMSEGIDKPPSAFVSYSWDDEDHKAWVRQLAERLRSDGVESTLDQWAAVPGDQLPEFMERAIAGSDYVLIICTPRYKYRSEAREGGVGYEGDIMTGELLQARHQRKFIPVLRCGKWEEAAPSWLAGKYYVDLRDGLQYETQYQDLLSTVLGTRPVAPPVASSSKKSKTEGFQGTSVQPPTPDEPVQILGIIADEVSEPRNDGTRGSALYRVPFRLSRHVSHDWARVFEQVWNSPPQYTLMHRPGIAQAHSDRIVLDGTTIEEVRDYHRDTLVLCVQKTNRIVAEHQAKARREAEARARRSEDHRNNVRDISDGLHFEK